MQQRRTSGFCLSPEVTPITVPGNDVRPSGILWSIWLLNSVDLLEGKWGQKGRPKTVIVLLVLRDTLGEVSKSFFSFYIFSNGLLRHLVICLPVILCYVVFMIKTEDLITTYTMRNQCFLFPDLYGSFVFFHSKISGKVKTWLKEITCGSIQMRWEMPTTTQVNWGSVLCSSVSAVRGRVLAILRLLQLNI